MQVTLYCTTWVYRYEKTKIDNCMIITYNNQSITKSAAILSKFWLMWNLCICWKSQPYFRSNK